MSRKRFKPSLASICAVSAAGLDLRLTPGGKEATRKAFTEADLKRVLERGDKKAAGHLATWLRGRSIVRGPEKGPYALTDKGLLVVARACRVWAKRGR